MKTLSVAIAIVALTASLAPSHASAQTPESAAVVLRFRQLGDTVPLARGHVDFGVQFAGGQPESSARNITRFGARVGVADRVDLGAWGGYSSVMNDGMAGVDVKVALVRQSASMPISISVRPSFSTTLGASDRWAANTGVDLSISRAYGRFAPYAGVAATSSLVTEHLLNLDPERDTTGHTLSFAGLNYTWRSLVAAVEVEKGTKVSYAFRLGTRF